MLIDKKHGNTGEEGDCYQTNINANNAELNHATKTLQMIYEAGNVFSTFVMPQVTPCVLVRNPKHDCVYKTTHQGTFNASPPKDQKLLFRL